jgi:hypothetical protein
MNRDDKRKLEPGAGGPGRKADADARQDSGKLRKNQERLHVGPDHKAGSMKKGRRGTYP